MARPAGGDERNLENLSPSGDEGLRADDQAGKVFGVSRNSVARAAKVLEHGSEKLKAAVEAEEIPLTTAAKLSDKAAAEHATDFDPPHYVTDDDS